MLKHSLIIGLVVLLYAGCSKEDEPLFFIEGRVVDDVTGLPLEGAEVEFTLHGTSPFGPPRSVGSIFTGPNGGFTQVIPIIEGGFIFGRKVPWIPSHVDVSVEGHCDKSNTEVTVVNSFTDYVEIRLTPRAHVRFNITNVGVYQGEFDQVDITRFGSVSLEPGFTDSKMFSPCFAQDSSSINVEYLLNSVVVHELNYPYEYVPNDSIEVNINY